jgi:hypothetical protein
LVGALVDKGYRLAIAFVNRPGPFEDGRDREAIQPRVAVLAFVDLDSGNGVAMTLVGQPVELSVAAIVAAAVDEFATPKFPERHASPPARGLRTILA